MGSHVYDLRHIPLNRKYALSVHPRFSFCFLEHGHGRKPYWNRRQGQHPGDGRASGQRSLGLWIITGNKTIKPALDYLLRNCFVTEKHCLSLLFFLTYITQSQTYIVTTTRQLWQKWQHPLRAPRFEFQICHLPSVSPWTIYFLSLKYISPGPFLQNKTKNFYLINLLGEINCILMKVLLYTVRYFQPYDVDQWQSTFFGL